MQSPVAELVRSLRLSIGVHSGTPERVRPHPLTGRADYLGQEASRHPSVSKHARKDGTNKHQSINQTHI